MWTHISNCLFTVSDMPGSLAHQGKYFSMIIWFIIVLSLSKTFSKFRYHWSIKLQFIYFSLIATLAFVPQYNALLWKGLCGNPDRCETHFIPSSALIISTPTLIGNIYLYLEERCIFYLNSPWVVSVALLEGF